ncbi:MAG: TIGR01777 family oxidoreductase [Chloroflexota bacterium]|nr:TIGR01777 family oxidoreductase [Chloroflexota bacterium]
MRAIVTGGTGLIGRALCRELVDHGHEVIVLSRNPDKKEEGLPSQVETVGWDAQSARGWGDRVSETDAIVNLAGAGLADGRWTDERKRSILESRVKAGQAVLEAVSAAATRPKVVIQSSAVGYYGPRGDEVLNEDAAPGSDYLARVCFDWEASTAPVVRMGVRRPVIRTGIVLTTEGGAFPKILLPFKLFAGGPMGNGSQYWPWIHINDEVRAIRFLMENETASGPFNLTAPNPLTNKEFASVVGQAMGRPSLMPAPAFALKLALGEMSTVLLDGQRAVPSRLQELGFEFDFATLDAALKDLLK